ncbi:hypothetical protein MJO28_006181 [Puccinia striiformis f. sp. tritici]|uniref:Uncharacterized protein n=1 Tax=Puccinia striiformis f. sp. tritici TaxID=168172 RepID=A0ACC0EHP5_9BASI|nr:hypothetical protein Pst134EA_011398 [Puccinia striiformis f. sp. tritici]KAH9467771.1 hypothetical protein Pst134EA_011398 [Puccinia striiformis f. sp. tritici]KAI7953634.1 hypothetical protein MJO28_006181 [Puccinia striiformis f. sp. tritici]KAI9604993.1 hypothetical protein H4Q26_002964 [Puccinia striiformis f. sp. tritici PST-130]
MSHQGSSSPSEEEQQEKLRTNTQDTTLGNSNSYSSISTSNQQPPPPEYLTDSQWNLQTRPPDHTTRRASIEIQVLSQPSDHHHPYQHQQEYLGQQQQTTASQEQPTPDHHSETDGEGQSYDDYDWDNDDDLDGDARFNDLNDHKDHPHQHRRRTLARRFSPYSIVKFLITTFIGNIFLSLLCLIPPLVLRYTGYYQTGDSQESIKTRFIYDNVAAWLFWASYNIVASWVLNFLTELIPRSIVLLVGIVWGDVNENIKGQVETFHTAKPWIKVIFYSAMCWGSWEVIFNGIYRLYAVSENGLYRAPYTETVHIIVELLFFFMLILSLEKLLLLTISMNFHQVAYAERIQKITRTFAVIDALKDYRPKRKSYPLAPNVRRGSGAILTMKGLSGKKVDPETAPTTVKSKWWSRNKGATKKEENKEITDYEAQLRETNGFNNEYQRDMPAQRSSKLLRRNSQTTFATLAQRGASAAKIARAAMKDPVSVVGKKSGLKLDVNNPTEARKLARKIYFGFKADSNRTYLIPSDFYPAFSNHDLAKQAFAIFDSDGNGDISRTEVKNEIFRAYKERRALANSLQDVSHAIGRLDRIMMAMSGIVFIFIALSIVGIDYSKALTSVYTVGIAAAFIFKETAGNVFDAIIMVFCTHPYDTGDRVIMDNDGVEEVLVVKRMGLLVTVFLRWDGTEWFAPNSLLGQKFIINLRRSTNQFENATLQFGWNTPLEKLDLLEERMNLWLQTDEQRRFEPGTACVIQSLVNQQYMEVTFGMTHRENWQDWGGRWNRRTAFHAALNHYTRELGISFYNSDQPIQLTNLTEFKDQLLNPNYTNEEEDQEEEEEDDDGDDEYDPDLNNQASDNPDRPSTGYFPHFIVNPDLQNSQNIDTTATETLGFKAPPHSGTGMRKRKKLAKKKTMLGDA